MFLVYATYWLYFIEFYTESSISSYTCLKLIVAVHVNNVNLCKAL